MERNYSRQVSTQERILCAAIHYHTGPLLDGQPKNVETGYVVCGRRHHNCIRLNMSLTGNVTRRETSIQGFLTSYDRFVDRLEGNSIAITSCQVVGNEQGDELISEDLY